MLKRYLAFILNGSGGNIYAAMNTTGSIQSTFDDVATAKGALADYIGKNKSAFQNGYIAFVIDTTTNTVASTATVPTPTLAWVDNK